MPDERQIAQPASLDYATLDADGNPEWIPEAEAAIDQGKSLRDIRKLFRKSKLAQAYLVRSLRRRFSYGTLSPSCVQCGTPTTMFVTVQWQFKPLGFINLAISESQILCETETNHTLCGACANAWFSPRLPTVLMTIGRWVYWIALGSYALYFISRYWFISRAWWISLYIFGAMGLGALISLAGRLLHRRTWPDAIKRQLPSWCKPNMIVDYSDLSEVREPAGEG